MNTNSEILAKKLDFPRAHRSTRLAIAHWVLGRPETFPELLGYCFKTKLSFSHKAAWILELVCIENITLLLPYLDVFFNNIPTVKKDQAVRPFSKICMILATAYFKKKNPQVIQALKESHKTAMTEYCFDCLITDQKVAAEAYSMTALFLLGTEIDWIHPELITIIEQNMNSKTAAYQSRGKITLKEIEKYRLKNLMA